MKIKRYAGESDIKFIVRACDNKTTETWDELAHEINKELGREQTSSSYRKMYQYYNIVKDAVKDESIEEQIAELEEKRAELELEKKKIQTLNVERNRVTRETARFNLWHELIADEIKRQVPPILEYTPVKNNDKEYVLTIADVHAGYLIETGTNEYNYKIMRDRFEILLSYVVNFVKEKNVEKLKVVLLGDLINGTLRVSSLKAQESSTIQSCIEVANMLVEFLNKLSAYVKVEVEDVVTGNHQEVRFLGGKAGEDMEEDFGYLIHHMLELALSNNDRITINKPADRGIIEFKIHDFNCLALHGNQVKSIAKSLTDFTMQNRKFYDFVFAGHLHNEKNYVICESGLHDCEVLQSSTFAGTDGYAESIMRGSKAACELYGFDKDFGKVETYKIILN